MWVVRGARMYPLLPLSPPEAPFHSCQTQTLPEVYVQNASLEIAWTRVVRETKTIAGWSVMPFVTEGRDGFDINQPHDWDLAELMIARGEAALPAVAEAPYPGDVR
jgi:N-acylneuraminate cytidylyltransferase